MLRSPSAAVRLSFLVLVLSLAFVAPAGAQTITVNSNLLFTPNAIYDSGTLGSAITYTGTVVSLTRLRFDTAASAGANQAPPAVSAFITDNFSASSLLDMPGLGTGMTAPAGGTAKFTATSRSGGGGEFDTEMLALNIAGGALPAGAMIRESPTLPSNGHTSVDDIGGGLYHIDSFFDIFTELSLDGGQTWHPSSGSVTVTETGTPEPGTMASVLLWSTMALRRRRR